MASRRSARSPLVALGACVVLLGATNPGCASGFNNDPDTGHGGSDMGHVDTGPPRDTGPMRDMGPMPDMGPHDSGPRDMGGPVDAAMVCGSMVCTGFTHCVSGNCVPYPMCNGAGMCPTPGDVCVSLRCVPGTVDIDGDGSPASMDCNEMDPTISPLAHEVCNGHDDNCNNQSDEGDPTTLCMNDPAHGVCMMGHCGCPDGTADIDLTVPGCECTIHPASTDGTSCMSPISLGTVFDEASAGTQMLTAMGNALPDREVWYRFNAADVADTTCDHYNVHVALTTNPGNNYEFQVLRGDCNQPVTCTDCTAATCMNFTDYRFAMDMNTGMTGQCPCATGDSPGVNQCADDTSDYFVRVRRHAGTAATCMQYTLTITNGIP